MFAHGNTLYLTALRNSVDHSVVKGGTANAVTPEQICHRNTALGFFQYPNDLGLYKS